MKTIVIPLQSKINLGLPATLYELADSKITLEKLSRADIEDVFGYRIVDNSDGSHTFFIDTSNNLISAKNSIIYDLAASTHKIVITSPNDNDAEELKDDVIFSLRLLLAEKCDFMAVQHIVSDTDKSWGTIISGLTTVPRRSGIEMNESVLTNIQDVVRALRGGGHNPNRIKTLRALLGTAMRQVGAIDVSCAFYISLLETLFISDKSNSEIAYKLSIRCARKYHENEEFFLRLRKAYEGRSKVFHGSTKGSVFSLEDNEFLERLAVRALFDYLKSPNDFDHKELDRLLLGR